MFRSNRAALALRSILTVARAIIMQDARVPTESNSETRALGYAREVEWAVVVHTGVGVVILLPILAYLRQHLVVYWTRPGGAVKWMGYLGTAATLVAVVSGIVLTVQALFGTRISTNSSPPTAPTRTAPSAPSRPAWP
jgi:hypothetical protein